MENLTKNEIELLVEVLENNYELCSDCLEDEMNQEDIEDFKTEMEICENLIETFKNGKTPVMDVLTKSIMVESFEVFSDDLEDEPSEELKNLYKKVVG